jgi:hypothetical protein
MRQHAQYGANILGDKDSMLMEKFVEILPEILIIKDRFLES